MRKILKLLLSVVTAVCMIFFSPAHAAQMVNVEYIHQLIARDWNIDIAYNLTLKTPKVAANMKYLLTVIDIANKRLNNEAITDYSNSEYATLVAADTIATDEAVRRLITTKPRFFITTTPDTDKFEFSMSATGAFVVDWGDGEKQKIVRRDTESNTYSHEYSAPGKYTISIGGRATKYSTAQNTSTISFAESCTNMASIDGSLGAVFSTRGSASDQQPSFYRTFRGCHNLTLIPSDLFTGVTGAAYRMFFGTFSGCTGLKTIPADLFADISGTGSYMFAETFYGCTNLTTIPSDLFAGISGSRAGLFTGTFAGCTGLKTIPAGLFAGVSGGYGAGSMFNITFSGCTSLESIPSDLFAGVTSAAGHMFFGTFSGCTSLKTIPDGLFANVAGAADAMFNGTFFGCTNLTAIPDKLFSKVSGTATDMFYQTFYKCNNLSGCIPTQAFAGVETDDLIAYLQSNATFYKTNITYEMCPASAD